MKVKIIVFSLVTIISLKCLNAQENKISFEINTGVSQAVKQINSSKLKTGYGFGGLFNYYFMPHTGLYASWRWNRFEPENSFAYSDDCFDET